jgi:ribosome-interacting GTPase 1
MPANLTPQYRAADAKFKAARSAEEKRAALEEMLATIPKHKGTEKMRADLKRRMARLRQRRKPAPPSTATSCGSSRRERRR